MKRRRLLQLVGMSAGGTALTIGSGAFTSVSASRTVSVSVVEDSNAYLKIIPDDDSGLVRTNASDGTIEFDLPGLNEVPGNDDAPLGEGVGSGSMYTFTDLIEVTNQGTSRIKLYSESSRLPAQLETVGLIGPTGQALLGETNAIEIGIGKTKSAGLLVQTSDTATPTNQRIDASFDIVGEAVDE